MKALAVLLSAAALSLAAYAFSHYPGSATVFIAFNLCFFALAGLIVPRPRLYVYTFLAGLLLLGFWLKVVVHAIWAPEFIEPVGDFANTVEEWDRALIAASCGAVGLIIARCGHLWVRWKSRRVGDPAAGAAPAWFVRWRRPVWIVTIALMIAVNIANLQFGFFQIGVNPKLILPLRIHVVLGWLVNVGFALWVAALLWWDCKSDRASLAGNLVAPMLEGLLSSVSAFSRLIYPLHAGPYWLAIFEHGKELASAINRRQRVLLIGCFLLLFTLSLLVVFSLRVHLYYGYETGGYSTGLPKNEPLQSHVQRTVKLQIPALIFHRWVGLEGVLTVGAMNNRSPELLMTAITESPKLGARSLYQRAAKAYVHYPVDSEKFTFLSNAGPVATLFFSGSLAIVFAGMALIGLILIVTEEMTRWWTANPFLLAVSGAALANVVSQTTFFYLTAVFVAQTWVAVGFLVAMQRLRIGEPGVRPVDAWGKGR